MDRKLFEYLESSMQSKIAFLPSKLRPYFANINIDSRGIIITGARGIGKTTFILNDIKNREILYISADNPIITGLTFRDIAETAYLDGYKGLAVDEVHYSKDWSMNLKSIYDDFPKFQIIACDSSSTILRKGITDLSRRFINIRIPLLSFREFIYFKTDLLYPVISIFDYNIELLNEIVKKVNVLKLFKEYISSGFRPIFLEGRYQDRIENILEKMIYHDVPFFVPTISENYLRLMNSIVGFLAFSPIPRLQVRSLCREWAIGSEKLYQILTVMEHIGLIRIVRKKNDFKTNTIGEKIFFYDPSFYFLYNYDNIGNIREAWVVTAFSETGYNIYAAKDETECDFEIDDIKMGNIKIEIGGKDKKRKKADYVISDDIELPVKKKLPLWLLGMLW